MEKYWVRFKVTPAGQSRTFPLAVEFSSLREAEAHVAFLEAEPEVTAISLTGPTCKRCDGPNDDEMLEYCADCRTLEPGY